MSLRKTLQKVAATSAELPLSTLGSDAPRAYLPEPEVIPRGARATGGAAPGAVFEGITPEAAEEFFGGLKAKIVEELKDTPAFRRLLQVKTGLKYGLPAAALLGAGIGGVSAVRASKEEGGTPGVGTALGGAGLGTLGGGVGSGLGALLMAPAGAALGGTAGKILRLASGGRYGGSLKGMLYGGLAGGGLGALYGGVKGSHEAGKMLGEHLGVDESMARRQEEEDRRVTEELAAMEERSKAAAADILAGGLADKKDNSDFSAEQLEMGKKVEREHSHSRAVAAEIARDHLQEIPDYYDRLEDMEEEAKDEGAMRKAANWKETAGKGALKVLHTGAEGLGIGAAIVVGEKGMHKLLKKSPSRPQANLQQPPIEKQAALNMALGKLWDDYGPGAGHEKHAAASYFFYRANKDERDVEALGLPFCKLASRVDKDPWELAVDIVRAYRGFEHLSKTASGLERELAEFYVRWADDMIKKAGIGSLIGRGLRTARSGAGALMGKMRSSTSLMDDAIRAAGKPGAAIPSAPKPVMDTMRKTWKQTGALEQMGGGSVARGEKVRDAMRADAGAAMTKRRAAQTAAPAPAQAGAPAAAPAAPATVQGAPPPAPKATAPATPAPVPGAAPAAPAAGGGPAPKPPQPEMVPGAAAASPAAPAAGAPAAGAPAAGATAPATTPGQGWGDWWRQNQVWASPAAAGGAGILAGSALSR